MPAIYVGTVGVPIEVGLPYWVPQTGTTAQMTLRKPDGSAILRDDVDLSEWPTVFILSKDGDLNQPGQYSAEVTVTLADGSIYPLDPIFFRVNPRDRQGSVI